MSRDPTALPDRWLHCPKIGDVILNLFVPFKTPLDEKFSDNIPNEGLRWEPRDLIGICRARKIQLGVVVDLTNSKRYYRPEVFKSSDIEYRKIACKGHGESPDLDATNEFVSFCRNFNLRNPHKLIGVHCTHGFNRTGFVICAYLVQVENCDLGAAVMLFQKARKPGIYKQDYMNDLRSRYGDPEEEEDVLLAADRPSWDGPGENSSSSKQFMEGIPGVSLVDDEDETEYVQKAAARMCEFTKEGFAGSQPVSMDRKNMNLLAEEPYVVSWKADGTRYMMAILGRDRVYFLDRDNSVFKVQGITFPKRKNENDHLEATLLDGEMVIDNDVENGQKIPRYLIYDIVHFERERINQMDFDLRTFCISKEIIDVRRSASAKGIIDMTSEPFHLRKKEFYPIQMTEKILGEKFQLQVSHEIDGLIFQPCLRPYIAGRCKFILKWKPPHLNTIDFRLQIRKTGGEGMLTKREGLLFVCGYKDSLAKLEKVDRQARELDGKIVECKCGENGWKILRERTDKSFPNGYKTAIGVWGSIQHPVTKEILLELIQTKAPVHESKFKKAEKNESKRNGEFAMPHPPPKRRHV